MMKTYDRSDLLWNVRKWVGDSGPGIPFFCIFLLASAVTSHADEAPQPAWTGPASDPKGTNTLFFQTTGEQQGDTGCGDGNWLTCEDGVNGDHFYEITVPCDWPSGTAFHIDIFSPWVTTADDSSGSSCGQANPPGSVCNIDERLDSPPDTTFTLWPAGESANVDLYGTPQFTPAGSSVASTTYTPQTGDHAWVRFHTIPGANLPAACGTYLLQEVVDWPGDERNGFALRTGWDNDGDATNPPPSDFANPGGATSGTPIGPLAVEPEWGGPAGGAPKGTLCLDYYYESGPAASQPTVGFYFFDLDFLSVATYTDPEGTQYVKSVGNRNRKWNGTASTTTTDVATVTGSVWTPPGPVPGIGDHFLNTTAGGVWHVELCMSSEDHYYYSGPFGEPVSSAPPPRDYGDAPASYGTLEADGGAFHTLDDGALYLGSAAPDADSDGMPSVGADGDDEPGADDEDGVTLAASAPVGQDLTVPVQVNGTGVLNAWFDWNGDGDFDDPGEQVTSDQAVSTDTTDLTVPVPADATLGDTYARFRLCTSAGDCNSPTGGASGGEVEDYTLELTDTIADVRVEKGLVSSFPAPPYESGHVVTYEIIVTNDGPATATDVEVNDLWAGLTSVTITGASSDIGTLDPGDCSNGDNFPCIIADMVDGEAVTITVEATVQ